MVLVDPEGTSVQRAVVEEAQRQAVVLGVGAAVAVPLDVGGLQAQLRAAHAPVVAADSAATLVDAEDPFSERGVPGAPEPRLDDPGKGHGVEDVLVDRAREVGIQEQSGDAVDEVGTGPEQRVEFGWKAGLGFHLQQDTLWDVL